MTEMKLNFTLWFINVASKHFWTVQILLADSSGWQQGLGLNPGSAAWRNFVTVGNDFAAVVSVSLSVLLGNAKWLVPAPPGCSILSYIVCWSLSRKLGLVGCGWRQETGTRVSEDHHVGRAWPRVGPVCPSSAFLLCGRVEMEAGVPLGSSPWGGISWSPDPDFIPALHPSPSEQVCRGCFRGFHWLT